MTTAALYPLPMDLRVKFDSLPATGVSIPANYRASKQEDGNYTIHDIDIFR